MKMLLIILLFCTLQSCKDPAKQAEEKTLQEQENFFQVTNFILGQLVDIQSAHLNPIVYTAIKGKRDSNWVSQDSIKNVVVPFLKPVIDSTNLKDFFQLTSFYDSTMKRFIFSHAPSSKLPDDFALRKWDIYIDPEAEKIERVYLEKITGNLKQILTWNTDKSCKIVEIQNDKIVKTTEMLWEFSSK